MTRANLKQIPQDGKDFYYTYDVLSRRTRLDMPNSTFTEYVYDDLNRLLTLRNKSQRYNNIGYASNTDNSQILNPNFEARISKQFSNDQNPNPTGIDLPIQIEEGSNDQTKIVSGIGTLENSNLFRISDFVFRIFKKSDFDIRISDFISDFFCQDAYAAMPSPAPSFPGVFSLYNYTYDNVSNRTTRMYQYMNSQTTETYGYDDIYQLTSNQKPGTSNQYDFDSVGNREVVTQNGNPTNYTANNLNQYSVVGAQNYTYDGNGNLTNDGTNTYTYDAENHLTSIEHPGSSIAYQYDGLCRRVSKAVNGVTTYYIYDGDRIIEERDANNTLLKSYVYGTGIDEILLAINHQPSTINYYYHYDGLGSVSDITDNNGYVVESYSYDVYGQPSQLSSIGNRYYFTGREYDAETGFYYYRNRYFNPNIGRFISRDPLTWSPDDLRLINFKYNYDTALVIAKNLGREDAKSEKLLALLQIIPYMISSKGARNPRLLNLYPYVNNNPVNWVDPSGLLTLGQLLSISGTVTYYTLNNGLFTPLAKAALDELIGFGLGLFGIPTSELGSVLGPLGGGLLGAGIYLLMTPTELSDPYLGEDGKWYNPDGTPYETNAHGDCLQ